MSRKSARRTIRDPMAWIHKRTPLADDQQRDLGLAYRMALQAMLRGHGTEQAWSTLACSLNIALILAEKGNGIGSIPAIKLAQAALMRTKERALRTGKWAFDGEGINQVQTAINLHDEQMLVETKAGVVAALREVHRRIEMDEVMV
jgi:hypothetical protein